MPKFDDGDEVYVVYGDLAGQYAEVFAYDETFDIYFVVPHANPDKMFGAKADELELSASAEDLGDEESYRTPFQEEKTEETGTPPFGLSVNEFNEYLDVLTKRVAKRNDFGPEINSQPGYLRFEETSMENLLQASLGEIEDWIAHGVMAHVRVARILRALNQGGFSQ